MKRISGLIAAAGLMLAASPALAQAVTVTNVAFTPGSVSGNLHSSAYNGDTGIGRFEFKGNYVSGGGAFDIFTYCVDLAHSVGLGTVSYTDYQIVPISAMPTITAAKANALNALLSNTTPLIGAATGQTAINISAATQMAAWEIMFETQPSWSVTNAASGFYVTTPGSSSADNTTALTSAQSLANGYLNNIATNAWSANGNAQLRLLSSPTRQTQVFLQAVPEPATWGLMILGFGAIGATLRRRSAKVAFA